MADKKKTEVNLEMCSGFFRIPTDDIIYNITVLASNETSTTRIVEKIIEVEKIVEVEKKVAIAEMANAPAVSFATPATDDYFERLAKKFQQEITLAVEEASPMATEGERPDDLSVIHTLAAMSTNLNEVLLTIKRQALSNGAANGSNGASPLASTLAELLEKISLAKGLCTPLQTLSAVSVLAPASKTVIRYFFNLDAVFQTIYELCTNETVKTHIKNARAKADEIFDKDIFTDAISPKVSGYPEDDGFMNVPMSDMYGALGAACSDKAICNLLIKMDKQQADIFLDQFLLMEIPASEEVSVAVEGNIPPADNSPSPTTSAEDSAIPLLDECQASLKALIAQDAEQGTAPPAAQDDLIDAIDSAMILAASIETDANRLANDCAERNTNPLWRKIKGLAVLTESMVEGKVADSSLSYENGLLAAQAAAQGCLAEITAKLQAMSRPIHETEDLAKKVQTPPEDLGEVNQDDIDKLLDELG